jgi:uncharacterized protein (DUF2267 family)
MPMPWTYRHASREWRAFLAEAREWMSLDSDNMAYTAIQAVLLTFRRRLAPVQALAFADALPCVPRAIFVAGWDPDVPPLPWAPREELTAEVMALRPNHNLTPPNAIEATARALRRTADPHALARALSRLPPEARAYWAVEGEGDASPRIV